MESRDSPSVNNDGETTDTTTSQTKPVQEPSSDFARTPAKTDEPLTERLFGEWGVRVIHYISYSLIFIVTFVLADLLLSTLATIVWGGTHFITHSTQTFGAVLKQHFYTTLSTTPVLIGSTILALIPTYVVYKWNEIRYKRGEWVRTYL